MRSTMDAQQMDLLMHMDCVVLCVIVHYGCSADRHAGAHGHCYLMPLFTTDASTDRHVVAHGHC